MGNDTESWLYKWGQSTLQVLFRTGATKIFLHRLIILGIFCTIFSFKIDSIIPFFVFISYYFLESVYFHILLPLKPHLFLDAKSFLTVLKFQNEIGNKKKGLHLPPPDAELVQPTIVTSEVNSEVTGKIRVLRKETK